MLNELCNLNGISGREHAVRDYIISHLPSDAEYRIDPLGSLIVYKKGKAEPKNKVMLDAHMDEVGFIITYITDDGYLKFTTVGGIDERVIFGRAVKVGKELIPGVIGGKAIHQTTSEERGKLPSVEDMYIDIGASSKKEALSHVSLGDAVYFDSCYREFGDGFIKAKAIDDRVGCEILLRLINSDLPYSATFCFSVQEEIGTRGAAAAAYSVAPDFAIVVEGTTAADISGVPDEKKVCRLGGGAVVSFMDRGTVYDSELYKKAFEIAEKNGIGCQTKTVVAGGNNASAIHKAAGGIKTLAVSVPCRYIHSGSSVAKKEDIEDALANLRTPIQYNDNKLRVQCFGSFEVFYNNKPVNFDRSKTKELFAYLIDRRGAAATTGELCGILWDEKSADESSKHYLRNLIASLKKSLKVCDAEDVFICKRNYFAVNSEKIECDYYKYLERDAAAVNSYKGEYMAQYSWAEMTLAELEKNR